MSAVALQHRTLYAGESWVLGFLLRVGGQVLNLGSVTATVTLRLRSVPGGAAVTRATTVVGQTRWITDGTDGGIEFLFLAAATALLPPGLYAVEIIYTDSATTPATKTLHAQGEWTILAPRTGVI